MAGHVLDLKDTSSIQDLLERKYLHMRKLNTEINSLIKLLLAEMLYNQLINFCQIITKENLRDSQSRQAMLPYHVIHPERREQNDSEFTHYLSLGSYTSSLQLPQLISFSKIMLTPKKHLPKLNLDNIRAKCQSQGFKVHSLVIPLYGQLSVDNNAISNLLQPASEINGQQTTFKKHLQIKQCKFVKDMEYISNKDQKDKNVIFLYTLYKEKQSFNQEQKGLIQENHSSRFQTQIKQKNINPYFIDANSSLQFSFIEALQDVKLELKYNDLVYLQKGKITLLAEESQTQIKNKGNAKGQQNYVDNMVYISENIKVQIQQGTLLFLCSLKEEEQK